jgi:transposase
LIVTIAGRNDVTQLLPLIDAIPPLRGRPGTPLRRPKRVFADRGYDSQPHRRELRRRGIASSIARRRTGHGSGLGRVRWVVERTFGWINAFHRLRTRYALRAFIHEALLRLAASIICWRRLQGRF